MKKISALLLFFCHGAFCGYGGYVLFQTTPASDGSNPTSPYTLLISGTFPQFATVANGGKVVNTVSCGVDSIACPADLIFAQDSSCAEPYAGWDVTAYSPATGRLSVWVAIPELSNTASVKIYGCVGNSLVTTFQGGSRGAGYDSNYLLALHMEETSGTALRDSTANANDASKKAASSPNPTTAGIIGGAQTFLGTANSDNNDFALFGTPTAATNTWTIEYWTNAISYINGDSVFLESSSGSPTVYTGFYWYPSGSIRFEDSYVGLDPTPPGTAGAGTFHYVVFSRNGDSMNVYLDGVAGTPVSGWGTGADQWKGLGWDGGANVLNNSFNGVLDEVFYSNIVRSPDYVTARYNNLKNPSGFYTVGPYTTVSTLPTSTTRDNSQVNIFF